MRKYLLQKTVSQRLIANPELQNQLSAAKKERAAGEKLKTK
jgi:hypothetical protein